MVTTVYKISLNVSVDMWFYKNQSDKEKMLTKTLEELGIRKRTVL